MQVTHQFFFFLINGVLLGFLALGFQIGVYWLLGSSGNFAYAIASAITYIPLIAINFVIQRALIFHAEGVLTRFIMASIFIMFLVSTLSALAHDIIGKFFGVTFSTYISFGLASLLGAAPSFMLSKLWVFK